MRTTFLILLIFVAGVAPGAAKYAGRQPTQPVMKIAGQATPRQSELPPLLEKLIKPLPRKI